MMPGPPNPAGPASVEWTGNAEWRVPSRGKKLSMAEGKLSTLDPELFSRLTRAPDETLRRLAVAACRYAVQSAGLKYLIVDAAIQSLTEQKVLTQEQYSELRQLVMALDAIQVDTRSREQLKQKKPEDTKRAASQARAANTVFIAINEDPVIASLDSIYAAYQTSNDWPSLKKILMDVLEKK
jgi:hypothetical protein